VRISDELETVIAARTQARADIGEAVRLGLDSALVLARRTAAWRLDIQAQLLERPRDAATVA
jgi:hypothetical protein